MKKEELKNGMWVVCLPGFNTDGGWRNGKSGGAGWNENRVVKIINFGDVTSPVEQIIAWPEGGGSGIFCQALRPATKWEIEHKQVQKDILYEIF